MFALMVLSSLGRMQPGDPAQEPPVVLIDQSSRFVMYAAPKAGATVATQIMFEHLGILGSALDYDPWIHKYRSRIFTHQPEHMPDVAKGQDWEYFRSCAICRSDGWSCVRLVRTPLDRVVSSYIHVMKHPPLKIVFDATLNVNASFEDFVQRLPSASQSAHLSNHYTRQSVVGCNDVDGDIEPNVMHVPVECLNSALLQVENFTGVSGLSDLGIGSHHYIKKVDIEVSGASNWPFWKVLSSTPSYDNFLKSPSIRHAVCRYYSQDVSLYRKTCAQMWLQGSRGCELSCAAELARLDAVCGSL